ncbi:alcohol dehydrogenase [Pseudozyma hubeiensis SY62]|uniref:Alcohol dehydrogenase n=1 Tax=Pseudozyma hubeiensis (strain SY62) TaxID=1305764 RepID=R9PBT7_PSEHS|nr:alcohol dehydrogenase [Pseudozyma hubeiensis SY62]GAC98858.1 alcohol dehydrogenase [Pseudozyma hubeiensis SY62]
MRIDRSPNRHSHQRSLKKIVVVTGTLGDKAVASTSGGSGGCFICRRHPVGESFLVLHLKTSSSTITANAGKRIGGAEWRYTKNRNMLSGKTSTFPPNGLRDLLVVKLLSNLCDLTSIAEPRISHLYRSSDLFQSETGTLNLGNKAERGTFASRHVTSNDAFRSRVN